ncbi:hypothetical protein BGZ76_006530, partial [Entomortierella beljakovae]
VQEKLQYLRTRDDRVMNYNKTCSGRPKVAPFERTHNFPANRMLQLLATCIWRELLIDIILFLIALGQNFIFKSPYILTKLPNQIGPQKELLQEF